MHGAGPGGPRPPAWRGARNPDPGAEYHPQLSPAIPQIAQRRARGAAAAASFTFPADGTSGGLGARPRRRPGAPPMGPAASGSAAGEGSGAVAPERAFLPRKKTGLQGREGSHIFK